MASAAGCISAQWNGALTLSGMKRRTPCALASCAGAVDGALGAGDHRLRRLVVVGELAHLALRRLRGELLADLLADAQQRRHRTLPDRHGRLHGLTADLQQPRGIGHAERARCGERGIFAQRMTGDVFDLVGAGESPSRFEHPHHRQRHGHQRRLGILGQRQRLERTLEHDLRRASGQARHRPRRTGRGPRHRPWPAPRPCRRLGCPARERQMQWSLALTGVQSAPQRLIGRA